MPDYRARLAAATSPVRWSDGGRPFDGYVLLVAALPTASGVNWSKITLRGTNPALVLPSRVLVPIVEGEFAQDAKIWRTDGIQPPGVKYCAFYYDSTKRLINYSTTLFTVESDTAVLNVPVLPSPDSATEPPPVEPQPGEEEEAPVGPIRENVAGEKNGVNVNFALSTVPQIAILLWNGLVLTEGVHYTLSGQNITMLGENIPQSGDTLEALLWL